MLETMYFKWFYLKQNINSAICTIQIRILCAFTGINLGKNSKFWGKPILLKYPKSKITIGKNCRFRSNKESNLIGISKVCYITTHSKNAEICIGEGSGFSGVSIASMVSITIGKKVNVGANTLITDFDWHNISPNERNLPVKGGMAIIIEDNVFIGYSTSILKGVTIGKNSVIGANSVVTSNIPANCIAAGNPCKVITALE
jgi:acetyltransferase-like isoleucine patch superfamily enzyme